MVSTSSPERAEGRSCAAADDGAGDRPRVALLAVAVEDVGQRALRQLVDQVGRGARLGRVHAHVERRVGGVREAALRAGRSASTTRRGRAGSRRRCTPVAARLRSPSAKLPRTKRARHVGVRVAEGREVLAHARVAVDRRCTRRGRPWRRPAARAWPPAPNVPSTTVMPGSTSSHATTSRASTGRCGREASGIHGPNARQHLRMLPSNSWRGAPPCLAIPDLQPVADARDDDVALQPGVVASSVAGRATRPCLSSSSSSAAAEEEAPSCRALPRNVSSRAALLRVNASQPSRVNATRQRPAPATGRRPRRSPLAKPAGMVSRFFSSSRCSYSPRSKARSPGTSPPGFPPDVAPSPNAPHLTPPDPTLQYVVVCSNACSVDPTCERVFGAAGRHGRRRDGCAPPPTAMRHRPLTSPHSAAGPRRRRRRRRSGERAAVRARGA